MFNKTIITLLFVVILNISKVSASQQWTEYPSLGIMTSFIKAPYEKGSSIHQWAQDLGQNFDADNWIFQFKDIGAEYLIFYAKWTNGFCLFDTKTTNYKSSTDYLMQISQACQKYNLPLSVYFNPFCDDNPDFEKWALKDQKGKNIVLSEKVFPHNMHTHYSPYGQIVLKQTEEILANYPKIDGLWIDVPYHRTNTISPYVLQAFRKMYNKKLVIDNDNQSLQQMERDALEKERIEPLHESSNIEIKEFEGRSVASAVSKK